MSDEQVKQQNDVRKKAIEIDVARQVKQDKERKDKDSGKES